MEDSVLHTRLLLFVNLSTAGLPNTQEDCFFYAITIGVVVMTTLSICTNQRGGVATLVTHMYRLFVSHPDISCNTWNSNHAFTALKTPRKTNTQTESSTKKRTINTQRGSSFRHVHYCITALSSWFIPVEENRQRKRRVAVTAEKRLIKIANGDLDASDNARYLSKRPLLFRGGTHVIYMVDL